MNTRKQVLIMSGLLMLSLLVVGIYGAWYPYREVDATEHFEELTNERGSILFARNCRLCHGDVGQGGALGARLPSAPALDRPDLQGFVPAEVTVGTTITPVTTTADMSPTSDIARVSNGPRFQGGQIILIDEERLEITGINGNELSVKRAIGHTEATSHLSGAPISLLDPAILADRVKLITNTLMCGRVGTAMPPWAQTQGGPLSDEQLRQLTVLITTGRWDLVEHEIDVEDAVSARLLGPVSADTSSLRVSDVSVFTDEEAIRIGEERLRVKGVPTLPTPAPGSRNTNADKSGILTVERGVLLTTPLEHAQEESIFKFPEVSEPSITQASCGQTARPAAPVGTPTVIENFTGQSVTLVAQNVVFDLRALSVRSGGQVKIRLDNRDTGVDHNVAVYTSSTNLTPVSSGSVGVTFKGPGIGDTAFAVPSAGNYFFRCDVHPTTMTGTFTVQ